MSTRINSNPVSKTIRAGGKKQVADLHRAAIGPVMRFRDMDDSENDDWKDDQ